MKTPDSAPTPVELLDPGTAVDAGPEIATEPAPSWPVLDTATSREADTEPTATETLAAAETPVASPESAATKRDWRAVWGKVSQSSALTSLLAVVVALVVGAILIAAADDEVQVAARYLFYRPGDFFAACWDKISAAYVALFKGAIFNFTAKSATTMFKPLFNSIAMSVPLILAGLGLSIGFRAGLFNIGAQGQIIIGATLCAYVGYGLPLPAGIHLIACLLAAFVGGALWGFIPGILKAKTGANEVIVTIMLNSISVFFLGWLLTKPGFKHTDSINPITPPVAETARLPHFFGTPVDLGIVVALLAAFGVWWLMERSTLGYRLRAVGLNPEAARTAGMKVESSYIWVLVIAGGLAGLAAIAQLLSSPSQQLTTDVAATFGFDAITVALLGRSKPLGTVLAGLLFGGLRAGGYLMQSSTGTPIDVILVLQSVIVLLIAAPPLVRAIFRLPDPDRRKKSKPPKPEVRTPKPAPAVSSQIVEATA